MRLLLRSPTNRRPFGIERQGVRLVELDRAGSLLADDRDQLAVLRKLQDARVGAAMPFGDEDVAVGRGHDVVGLIEVAGIGRAARCAERHQQLAVRTELEYLVTFGRARRRPSATAPPGSAARVPRRVVLAVGHPDVAVAIDVHAVREDQQPGAEALDERSRRVELRG